MPTKSAPRGGNAYYVGKGKCKKDKGKGKGRDTDSETTASLSSFASFSSNSPIKSPRLTSHTAPVLTAEHNPEKPYLYCWFHG
jgi:hypothetical protein